MEKPNRVATVGQLRAELEGIPDDTPLVVNAADLTSQDVVDEQVITSTGFGLVDWGDGYGLEPDNVFALNCDLVMPDEDVRRKPTRPARQATAETAPAAEPEAEP
jgi:hypothetical protein